MSSEVILSGVTFSRRLTEALPSISGLSTFCLFGSGFDAINTNRVSGGPALVKPTGAVDPTFSSNYATFGGINPQALATATVSGGAVTNITFSTGGSGYVSAPHLVFSGGGGSGASATAVLTGGVVTGFTSLVGGSGYTSAPTILVEGGNIAAYDTANPRNSTILAAGWSVLAVARTNSTTGTGGWVSDENDASSTVGNSFALRYYVPSSTNTLAATGTASGTVVTSSAALSSAPSNWRCIAYNYTGGSFGTLTAYNLTDSTAGTPFTYSTGVPTANNFSPHIGPGQFQTQWTSGGMMTADIAAFMVINRSTSQADLTTIYNAIKAMMSFRGITV